jgi:hypothetical protein
MRLDWRRTVAEPTLLDDHTRLPCAMGVVTAALYRRRPGRFG